MILFEIYSHNLFSGSDADCPYSVECSHLILILQIRSEGRNKLSWMDTKLSEHPILWKEKEIENLPLFKWKTIIMNCMFEIQSKVDSLVSGIIKVRTIKVFEIQVSNLT